MEGQAVNTADWDEHSQSEIISGAVEIDGKTIPTRSTMFYGANVLAVEVGSNCPQGGDSGHGGRSYLAFTDEGGTDMRVRVTNDGADPVKIELIFGGDSENYTLIKCLEFALSVLQSRVASASKSEAN